MSDPQVIALIVGSCLCAYWLCKREGLIARQRSEIRDLRELLAKADEAMDEIGKEGGKSTTAR
jgi:hypothetical protein